MSKLPIKLQTLSVQWDKHGEDCHTAKFSIGAKTFSVCFKQVAHLGKLKFVLCIVRWTYETLWLFSAVWSLTKICFVSQLISRRRRVWRSSRGTFSAIWTQLSHYRGNNELNKEGEENITVSPNNQSRLKLSYSQPVIWLCCIL